MLTPLNLALIQSALGTPEDKQLRIVTNGGASEKLSPVMPPFGEALTAQQIRDVVAYVRTTFQAPPAVHAAK